MYFPLNMGIFQCHVSFQGCMDQRHSKPLPWPMLVTFAGVRFVWVGFVFLLLTVPKPVLLRCSVPSWKRLQQKSYLVWGMVEPCINPLIHPSLSIHLTLLSQSISIYKYNLSYQPIYPSTTLSLLPWRLKQQTSVFSQLNQKNWTFFSAQTRLQPNRGLF